MDQLPNRPDRGRAALLPTALTLMIGALAVVGILLGLEIRDAQRDNAFRGSLLAAAGQHALNFATLDYRTFDRDTGRVLDGAIGAFKTDYAADLPALEAVAVQNEAVAVGELLDAAIVDLSGDRAQVIVAADGVVTTAGDQRSVRRYLIQMELVRRDGEWLVARLGLIPPGADHG